MTQGFDILVVDDERGFRDLWAYLLGPLGVSTSYASDGKEAVELAEKKNYDLILMDVHMPRLTGVEALREIKSIRPEQKVILFSSSADADYPLEKEAGGKDGALACLFKPVELDDLLRVLKEALGENFNV